MPQSKIVRKPGLSTALSHQTLWWDRNKRTLAPWVRMFKPVWEDIAIDQGLNRTELRILLLCAVNLGPSNRVILSQADIAFALSLAPSLISRAMKQLRRMGLLFTQGHAIFLNSRLNAEGKARDVAELRREEIAKLRQLDPSFHDAAFPKE